jgi:hypothetical protein
MKIFWLFWFGNCFGYFLKNWTIFSNLLVTLVSFIMLSVVILSAIMRRAIILSVVILNVILLIAKAPFKNFDKPFGKKFAPIVANFDRRAKLNLEMRRDCLQN